MIMMTRVWIETNATSTWKPTVEEHTYKDGTKHYSFRNRFGRPYNVDTYEEAMKIVKDWGMVDMTEKFREDGWIE